MKILLAVDGSAYTKKMLAYITTHTELFAGDNEFTLLSVQMPLPARARSAVGKDAVDAYYVEESAKVLEPSLKFMSRHELKCKGMSKVGRVGETIAKTAESGDYDMLVMGSHGHSALGGLVMGSVSTNVLAHCTVPVLLIR
ncbi:universal stress protein [Ottowia sp.]|uniref:universal stress protein n=1 Tax=Ottowia sp. TaxID=1898956 RepID=UPI003A89214E